VTAPEYDHRIIERYAGDLYRKGTQLPKVSAVVGGVIGLLVGALPFSSFLVTPFPKSLGFATILLGLVVGGLIGYVVGDGRSFSYLLQAQQALCQVQTERNTAAAARAAMSRAAAPAAARAAAPQPQPPAPVAAPAPAPAPVQVQPPPSQLRSPIPAAAAAGGSPAASMPPLSPPLSS
jgi:hypothetical protein